MIIVNSFIKIENWKFSLPLSAFSLKFSRQSNPNEPFENFENFLHIHIKSY